MTGVDTNVLLRLVLRDDEAMVQAAERFLQTLTPDQPGFVSHVTLCEVVWTLARRFQRTRNEIFLFLDAMEASAEIRLERPAVVREAVLAYRRGGPGFSDHLIAAVHAAESVDGSVTFDRKLSRLPGWRLLR